MKFFEGKYSWTLVATAGAVLATLVPRQITDVVHEAVLVGMQWFDVKVIPLVQSYSHQGPFSLYAASWWERLAGSGTMSVLLDAAIGATIALLLWYITGRRDMKTPQRIGFVLLGLAVLAGSGALEHGPSPMKLGYLLVLLTVAGYIAWKNSGPSYWFGGATEHNWRYLLLSSISFSLLMYTELAYALPLLILGSALLYRETRGAQSKLTLLAFYAVPLLAHSWVWISFFESRDLLRTWIDTMILHIRIVATDDVARLGLLVFVPVVVVFCFAIYHARGDNYRRGRGSWALAIAVLLLSVLVPKTVLVMGPLLMLVGIRWADARTTKLVGTQTVYYGGLASAALVLVLFVGVGRVIRLENGRVELARSYVEQRLIDESDVFYYGRGAGFYNENVTPATSFVDGRVFSYDTADLGLIDRLRGENEASSPRFVVVPVGNLSVPANDRINDYINKHYEKTASVDGFDIYKRL